MMGDIFLPDLTILRCGIAVDNDHEGNQIECKEPNKENKRNFVN